MRELGNGFFPDQLVELGAGEGEGISVAHAASPLWGDGSKSALRDASGRTPGSPPVLRRSHERRTQSRSAVSRCGGVDGSLIEERAVSSRGCLMRVSQTS